MPTTRDMALIRDFIKRGGKLTDPRGREIDPATLGAAPSQPAPIPLDEKATEKLFQATVEKTLRDRGWLVYHTRDSRKSEAGFPDVIALRAGYMIVAEL